MKPPLLFWEVDTQVDFMSPDGALYVPDAESVAHRIGSLTAAARDHHIALIASADDHSPGDAEISTQPDFKTTFPPHCMQDSPGAERIAECRQDYTLIAGHERMPADVLRSGLGDEQPRVLILKKTLDAFSNPNTERILGQLNPATVVIYGVALDFCNRVAVERLLERGDIEVVVVTDATKPIYAEGAPDLLAEWKRRGVTLATTEEVLSAVEAGEAIGIRRALCGQPGPAPRI